MNDKLPRNHAYIRTRNNGATASIDFPERSVAWIDDVFRMAVSRMVLEESSNSATPDPETADVREALIGRRIVDIVTTGRGDHVLLLDNGALARFEAQEYDGALIHALVIPAKQAAKWLEGQS